MAIRFKVHLGISEPNNLKKSTHAKNVDSFPLTIAEVARQYRILPVNTSNIFYHYTTKKGLEGILRSGGLRATYRGKMNDPGEFDYAKGIIFQTLDEIYKRPDLLPVTQRLTEYIRKNLDKVLKPVLENSSSYCTCLTLSSDHLKLWETYADNGRGFALGFNLHHASEVQARNILQSKYFIFYTQVIYDKIFQCSIVPQLVKAGINDLQLFNRNFPDSSKCLTELRDRVMFEIICQLYVIVNFIKCPSLSSELEIRLMGDSNNGTVLASDIQYYPRDKESVPYIFFNLLNPVTKLLPIAEIKIGPNASFPKEQRFLKDLLKELGYNSNGIEYPRITNSGSET